MTFLPFLALDPPICATVHEATTEAALDRMLSAAPECGLLELRLDAAPAHAPLDLDVLLRYPVRQVLVTCRPPRQGGGWRGEESERLALLRRAAERGAWIDVERDAIDALLAAGPFPPVPLVVSSHPEAAPAADFPRLLAELRHPAADVTKLALPVDDARDALALLRHAAQEPQPTIAIGMTFPGVVTRLAGLRAGAPWTYAAADPDRPAAPGQLPARTARALLGRPPRSRSSATRLFGVLGRPVGHSRSPALMNAAFEQLGLDALYSWLETTDVAALLDEAERDPGIGGFSVTIPHKLAAAAVASVDPAPEVRALGALNTLVRLPTDRAPHVWSGHNTDALAAEALLRQACGDRDPSTVPLALLGSGGAARAVAYAAALLGLPTRVYARTPANADALVAAVAAAVPGAVISAAASLEALPPATAADAPAVIVNATSVGMTPDVERSPVDPGAFGSNVTAYDLVYTPVETRFLRDALAQGARTLTGLAHFVAQARAQLELWLGADAIAGLSDDWLAERARVG